jgi:hypothetical protein
LVRELVAKGAAQMRDIAEQINELAENGEEIAIAEQVQGLSSDAVEHLKGLVSPGAVSMILNAVEVHNG